MYDTDVLTVWKDQCNNYNRPPHSRAVAKLHARQRWINSIIIHPFTFILTCPLDALLCSTDPKPACNGPYHRECSSSLRKMDVHPTLKKTVSISEHIRGGMTLVLTVVSIALLSLTSNFGNSCIIRESLSWKFCWVYFTLRM
jgi:hypothetical protein